MRAELMIAKCGFILQAHEDDVCRNEKVIIALALYWRRWSPRRSWRLSWGKEHGTNARLAYRTYHNEKFGGWILRGPLQRIS